MICDFDRLNGNFTLLMQFVNYKREQLDYISSRIYAIKFGVQICKLSCEFIDV
jgi:hypothetical protein